MNGKYKEGDVVLHNWTLIRKLGEGSFGKVYEAERTEFGVTYKAAVKIITIPQNESEIKSARAEGMDEASLSAYFYGMVQNIIQEISLMSQLKGTAHVVSYEDHAVIPNEDGIGWDILIRMEKLTPLLDYMEEREFSRQDVIKLGVDMCRALELCQRYNIIHRDIKPENIFVSKTGDFKLGDFGIARTMERTSGSLSKKGTYTYMAPEVYKEERYGSNVDTYSLGIVMYRLLNNNRGPFLPEYPKPISYAAREKAIVKRIGGAELPYPANEQGRLAEIVLKACAYKPRDRYSSPVQMRQELETLAYTGRTADERKMMPEPERGERIVSRTAVQSGRHETSAGAVRTRGRAAGTHAAQKPDKTSSQKKPKRYLGKLAVVAAFAVILLLAFFAFFKSADNKRISEPEITQPPELVAQDEATPSAPQDDAGENIVREERYASDGSVSGWIESEYNSDGKKIKETNLNSDGSVESITDYDTAGNKIKTTYESNGYITYITEYDSAGIKVKTTKYNPDGSSIYEWYEYEHDSAGNMTKETTYNNPDGSVKGWTEHEYDDAGNEIKETKYNPDGSIGSLLEYNSAGNLIKEIGYELDGSTTFWIEYEFDSAGNNVKRTDYNPSGTPALIQEYGESGNLLIQHGYDASGNEIETRYYKPDGSVNYWYGYEYDTAGNLGIETLYRPSGIRRDSVEYNAAGKVVRRIHYNTQGVIDSLREYDAAENLIKETHYSSGGDISLWVENEYDVAGNMIKSINYNSVGDISHWAEYEYDAAGNVKKETNYNADGSLFYVD